MSCDQLTAIHGAVYILDGIKELNQIRGHNDVSLVPSKVSVAAAELKT
jgi:hypothetical protein